MASDNHLFPAEIVTYTAEHHFQQYNTRSKIIYLIILFFVVATIISLWLIKVDINVTSAAILRPLHPVSTITTPVEGRIDSLYVSENMHVKQGQIILTINAPDVDEQSSLLNTQQTKLRNQEHDLQKLTKGFNKGLKTNLYQQQYQVYMQNIEEAGKKYFLEKQDFDRYKILYQHKVISTEEFEKYEYNMQNAANNLRLVKEQQLSQWQNELTNLQLQLDELNAKQHVNNNQLKYYTIRAVTSGYIQDLKGVRQGSFVSANEQIGDISPESGLIVEASVSPKDIGMINRGMPVHVQIDAYDYNQWGMLDGKVMDISNDIHMQNSEVPYFKVRCKLDRYQLKLKNGYSADVKKGMTAQVRFRVARKSLYQLLYNKTDSWINPNETTTNEAKIN